MVLETSNCLPPEVESSGRNIVNFYIKQSIFADDTTVLGRKKEINEGTNLIKKIMGDFEEKCHDGKEERMFFGTEEGNKTRMLGSYIGRSVDVNQRGARIAKSWFLVKKRLRKSKLTRRTQALVIESCGESTGLFDSAIRPCHASEVHSLQRQLDKCYSYVWRKRNQGPTLIQL